MQSRAFAFNHNCSMLFELLPTHPHLLERSQWAQNRASYPGCELSFSRVDNLNSYILRSDLGNLSLQSFCEALEARVSACENDILEEIFPYVDVGHADRIDYHVLHASKAFSRIFLVEHPLHYAYSLSSNWDLGTIWQLKPLSSYSLVCTNTLQRFFRNVKQITL